MNIEPIAYFHSPLTAKFGIPRQSGLATDLQGHIVLEPAYRSAEAVRGLDGFDYIWLIWGFSANSPLTSHHSSLGPDAGKRRLLLTSRPSSLTVRPPRLGGNERVGVFASRSPFRPNGLGLSAVCIDKVEMSHDLGPVIHVLGADLMDGTPIYDIKPYVAYCDSHADVRSGFVDTHSWQPLRVVMEDRLAALFSPEELAGLRQVLAQDPRPRYHDDPLRVYGMSYGGRNVKFTVGDGILTVVSVETYSFCFSH